ncbi:MAG: TRAP transporter substrate-binding protein DctP, partial [Deltaproteobacteria bacterium]|nr:TRAP transporter substrate-binding protein DctP [Deltaproteobacteria bacterium]
MNTFCYHLESSHAKPMRGRGKNLGVIALFLLLLFFGSLPSEAAELQHEIKLATLAPENSTLMKIFREMDSEVRKETEGRVGFKLFSGFVLGDERDVFRKLRIGLIHAATFTSTFLAEINPDIRTLQLPFLF